jgi:hypothetical protein
LPQTRLCFNLDANFYPWNGGIRSRRRSMLTLSYAIRLAILIAFPILSTFLPEPM